MKHWLARCAVAALMGLAAINASADAGALRAKYTELREPLRNNPYHRPIVIDSAEQGDTLKGDIYAVLNHPYDALAKSLQEPADWCAILILPFNTKYCHPVKGDKGTTLAMRIGRKADQPVTDAYRIDFALRQVAAGADYLESRLAAAQGPVGTRDYRIAIEAIPLDAKRTFMHLSYSYAYGGMGRFAMQAYLSTAGANKVGFSVAGKDGNGEPIYIGGVRGAIERNVMRYYLAVDAHLASLTAPPDEQLDKRIQTWFDSTERYARQLHEMDRAQYVAMKKGEYERQQALLQ
ncbi:hypothetical protein [Ramlibacter sp. PS4R-6]|uniref:hypothetical protein n=1 Tax=Ramlibacter sp. PS4R-6 TaxID=3133438 RepID=UPI003096F056